MIIRHYIFDSFAIIAYLNNEKGSDQIGQILIAAKSGKAKIYIHAVNLGEVYYHAFKEEGESVANVIWGTVKNYPLEISYELDEGLLLDVCRIKGRYPVSYADAFALMMAKRYDCHLVTGDPEIKRVEIAKLVWIG